ncbi:hypothetical protein [Edaphobacter dinghuensis]|uniref:hypothetical protein n=1 Tax=Edaphobacter dinghuensis TaxID=1560005 RepID=UPI0021DF6CBA|nr:hypothetical protein [Edaphobacter dinghuensis]
MNNSSIPDLQYIRENVSIIAVARELGLTVNGYRARCWRTENHRNGDADPSMAFRKKQNTGRCFICDPRTWSNIDLVMLVRDCKLREAIAWITDRFPVPSLPKGAHIKKRESWSPCYRASDTDSVVGMLVRSGLWSTLSNAERSILPVLSEFMSCDTGLAEISYRGLMQHSGVGSQATIAAALQHFEQMRFLQVIRNRAVSPLRRVNQYYFTLDDPEFQAIAANTFQQQRAEIELQKQLRSEEREARCQNKVPV